MTLAPSPLRRFSSCATDSGKVRLTFRVPWSLPWEIEVLKTAVLWELAAACSLREQVVLRQTALALQKHEGWQPFQSCDTRMGRSSRELVEGLINDLSRVAPRPEVSICGPPLSDSMTHDALESLKSIAQLELRYIPLEAHVGPPAALGARRLLGTFGVVDPELRAEIERAVRSAGHEEFARELAALWPADNHGIHAFHVSSTAAEPMLQSIIDQLAPQLPISSMFDWFGLGFPMLVQDFLSRPKAYLDTLQRRLSREFGTRQDALRLELALLRHLVACLPKNQLFQARLDYIEADICLKIKSRRNRALSLLEPYLASPPDDAVLACHIMGQAGRAAALLGLPDRALALYEANLAAIPRAFAPGDLSGRRAQGELKHKMGQLLRENPNLSGGRPRAWQLLQESLDIQDSLGMQKGVAMCQCEFGQLCLDEGALDTAEKWFQGALNTDRARGSQGIEGTAVDLHGLAKVYERQGNLQKALSTIDRVEAIHRSLDKVSPTAKNQVQNTRQSIEQQLGIREAPKTEVLLKQLESYGPEDDRACSTFLRRNASLLREAGRSIEAETLLRAGLQKVVTESSKAHLKIALASLLLDLRRHDEADQQLKTLSSTEPNVAAEIDLVRARHCLQIGNLQNAEQYLDGLKAEASEQTRSRAHALRARLFSAQENYTAAAAQLVLARNVLTETDPAQSHLLEQQSSTAMKAGLFVQAAAFAKELLAIAEARENRARLVKPHLLLGDALYNQSLFEAAATEFERALSYFSGESGGAGTLRTTLLRRAAMAWTYTGNFPVAEAHVKEALALVAKGQSTPEQAGWIYKLAAHLYRVAGDLNKFDEVMKQAEAAAEASDDDRLINALASMRAGDLRMDTLVDVPAADGSGEDSTAALLQQARLLRHRRRHAEALRFIDNAELLARTRLHAESCTELRVAVMLDMQEAGLRVDLQPALTRLRDERKDAELPSVALTLLARAEVLRGQYDEALSLAELAYVRAEERNEYLSLSRAGALLSKIHSKFGRHAESTDLLRGLAEFMYKNGRKQQAFDAQYSVCRQLITAHDLVGARQELALLTERYSSIGQEDEARLESARAELERIDNRPLDAKRRLEQMLERLTKSGRPELRAPLEVQLTSILVDLGDMRGVQQQRQRLEATNFRQSLSVPARIKALLKEGRDGEALALAQGEEARHSARTSDRAVALNLLAMALTRMKLLDQARSRALEALELHVELDKKNGIPSCRVTLAEILAQQKQHADAISQLETALGENQAAANEKGIQICQRLLQKLRGGDVARPHGDTARDLLSRAHDLRRAKKPAEAALLMQKALVKAREDGDRRTEAMALGAIGMALLTEGRIDPAIAHLTDAVTLHDELGSHHHAECSLQLARALDKKGLRAEALTVLKTGEQRVHDPTMKQRMALAMQRLTGTGKRPDAP
jgi:hypothetical protein